METELVESQTKRSIASRARKQDAGKPATSLWQNLQTRSLCPQNTVASGLCVRGFPMTASSINGSQFAIYTQQGMQTFPLALRTATIWSDLFLVQFNSILFYFILVTLSSHLFEQQEPDNHVFLL